MRPFITPAILFAVVVLLSTNSLIAQDETAMQSDPTASVKNFPALDSMSMEDRYALDTEVAQLALVAHISDKLEYPASALLHGNSGRVIIDIFLDQEGKVKNVRVLQSAGSSLDESAKKAVDSFELGQPYLGAPVLRLPVDFNLR